MTTVSDHIACSRTSRRTRRVLAFASLALVGLGPTACDNDVRDDPIERFRQSLPSDETLALDVPGEEDLETSELPLETIEAPLIGEPSAMRMITRTVRRSMHQLIANVTDSFALLTNGPPTLRTANGAVWRVRLRAEGSERALVMRRSESSFEYSVWARDFGATQWRFILFGRVFPGRDGDARGAMWIDLDNDRFPRSQGKAAVLWSVIDDARAVDVTLYDGTSDDAAVDRMTRNYSYQDSLEGGRLAFDAGDIDVHITPDHRERERVRVFTRWNGERAFRSDYSARGVEVHDDGYRILIGSECWQAPDASITFESRIGLPLSGASAVTLFERGQRQTCAFQVEEPPIVAQPGAAPSAPSQPAELEEMEGR